MTKYRYVYVKCAISEVDGVLEQYAAAGFRVHTFNRNSNASTVDILLEVEIDS